MERASVLSKWPLARRRGTISTDTVGDRCSRGAAGTVGAGVCAIRFRVRGGRVEKRRKTGLVVGAGRTAIGRRGVGTVGRLGMQAPGWRDGQCSRRRYRKRSGRVSLLVVTAIDRRELGLLVVSRT
jgi:hypothetical protein